MTNKTKIIIGVSIVAAIVIAIYGIVNNLKDREVNDGTKDTIENMVEYINRTEQNDVQNIEIENNVIEENTIVEENVISEENKTNNQTATNTSSNSNVNTNVTIGKEEQESSNANSEADNKELAINLAKEEWAISINSYDFQASELKSDGTYDVSVINKTNRNVIAIYNVNVTNKTVKDITE